MHNLRETTNLTPMQYRRNTRRVNYLGMTSGDAGKIVPLRFTGLLREEAIKRSKVGFSFRMSPTPKPLATRVAMNVAAYFVPLTSFERFKGIEHFNRSYSGQTDMEGVNSTTNFITSSDFGTGEIYRVAGLQATDAAPHNMAYKEAYNVLVNYLRKNVSSELPQRDTYQPDVAVGFWGNHVFSDIVSDYDSALLENPMPMSFSQVRVPVSGIGFDANTTDLDAVPDGWPLAEDTVILETSGSTRHALTHGNPNLRVEIRDSLPAIFAELADSDGYVSMANLQNAHKTAAFAKIRRTYRDHEDHVIELLQQGFRLPELSLEQPLLLDSTTVDFAFTHRSSTDADALDVSTSDGYCEAALDIQLGQTMTGGVVVFVAQMQPEQIFERQRDPYLAATSVSDFPRPDVDWLDADPVTIVRNGDIDVQSDDPEGIFGYRGLNAEWRNQTIPVMGGIYYRRFYDDPWTEDRNQIWSVETPNISLSEDFYLMTNVDHRVFTDVSGPAFHCRQFGGLNIDTWMRFGDQLLEATDDFAEVEGLVDFAGDDPSEIVTGIIPQ